MAFGQELAEKTISSRLFRKVSSENLLKTGELCFSTEDSVCLIGRGEFCLVFEQKKRTGLFFDGDADSGINTGYDEFRYTIEDLLEIEYIVVPNEWVDSDMDIESEGYIQENDPAEWIENLSQYGKVVAVRDFDGNNIDFNF